MYVEVGRQINAHEGRWLHATPTSYAYQWQQGDAYSSLASFKDITGETAATYTVRVADENKTLRCRVTPKNSANQTAVEYTPHLIVHTGRTGGLGTGIHHSFAYGLGGVTGVECVLGVWANATPKSPIVLFLHEGGFTEQVVKNEPAAGVDLTTTPEPPTNAEPNFNLRDKAENFRSKGWTAICVNWRQDSNAVKPGCFIETIDIFRAIQWAKANAEAINGDPGKVVLVGGSGGASLAVICASLFNQHKGAGFIKGVGMCSGIADLANRVLDALSEIVAAEAAPFATLSAGLSTAANITTLPVAKLTAPVPTGTYSLVSGGAYEHNQVFKVTVEGKVGDEALTIESKKPNFAFPIGSLLVEDLTEHVHHINHIEYFTADEGLEKPGYLASAAAGQVKAHLDTWSALANLGSWIPPIIYYISEKDKVPTSQGTILKERLEALGLGSKLTFRIMAGGPHAFAMWANTSPTGKSVSEDFDEFLKAAVA